MACWLVGRVGGIDGGRLRRWWCYCLLLKEGVGVGERSGVERFGCARAAVFIWSRAAAHVLRPCEELDFFPLATCPINAAD